MPTYIRLTDYKRNSKIHKINILYNLTRLKGLGKKRFSFSWKDMRSLEILGRMK